MTTSDNTARPWHYTGTNGTELADVIGGFGLSYYSGAAVKYLLRHDRKGDPEGDLKKARASIDYEIARRFGYPRPEAPKAATKTLHYLATPYTRYRGGIKAAYNAALRITARLTAADIDVFSPIVHSHPLCFVKGVDLDPRDGEFWMRQCAPFMERADVLLVATLPGWRESRGVTAEIAAFKTGGKPVVLVHPKTLKVSDIPEVDEKKPRRKSRR